MQKNTHFTVYSWQIKTDLTESAGSECTLKNTTAFEICWNKNVKLDD